jgi:hypothetical protein
LWCRPSPEAKSNAALDPSGALRHRALLSLGYGPHDVFTDDFEVGILLRNDLFNRRQLCGGEDHLNACAARHIRGVGLCAALNDAHWSALHV